MKEKLVLVVLVMALPLAAVAATNSRLDKANAAMEAKHYTQAYHLFRPLAERGNAEAAGNLATLYIAGWGVPRNPKKAFKWALKSAKGGRRGAQYLVASLYDSGTGVKQNHARAVHWYEKAGEQ